MQRATWVFLTLLLFLLTTNNAYAADAVYRLMHDYQDALILGEITKIDDDICVIAVSDTVVNAEFAKAESQQLKPKTVILSLTDVSYTGYEKYIGDEESAKYVERLPAIGDYVLASVDKKGSNKDMFEIAHGIYLVDSLDKNTLLIILPEDAPRGFKMDAATIESFIHSDGVNTEFFISGGIVGLYLDEEHDGKNFEIIYPVRDSIEPASETNPVKPQVKEPSASKVSENITALDSEVMEYVDNTQEDVASRGNNNLFLTIVICSLFFLAASIAMFAHMRRKK